MVSMFSVEICFVSLCSSLCWLRPVMRLTLIKKQKFCVAKMQLYSWSLGWLSSPRIAWSIPACQRKWNLLSGSICGCFLWPVFCVSAAGHV